MASLMKISLCKITHLFYGSLCKPLTHPLVCSSLILSSRLRKDIQHLLLEGFSHFLPIAIQDVHLDRRMKFTKLQKSQDDANPAWLGGHY